MRPCYRLFRRAADLNGYNGPIPSSRHLPGTKMICSDFEKIDVPIITLNYFLIFPFSPFKNLNSVLFAMTFFAATGLILFYALLSPSYRIYLRGLALAARAGMHKVNLW